MNKTRYIVLIIFLLQSLSAQTNYHLFINEFLASNVSINADMVDFDDYSDWIELYNDEEFEADMGGYFITDNLNNPFKWQFPEGTIIPAQGFLQVWADGYDDIPGHTYTRPYRDQNNDPIYFTTDYYHLNFNLSRSGEEIGLYDPNGVLIDSISFGLQLRDVSRGRFPDGGPDWYYFSEPTPQDQNITEATLSNEFTLQPEIALPSGFYQGSQTVTMEGDPATKIYFTLNGEKPSSQSDSFTTPISITQNTVLRARLFESGKLADKPLTRSYFINEDFSLPVISIGTSPPALWDDKIGIYTNLYKGREIPIHFDYFNAEGLFQFGLYAGLRLTGQLSLYYAQKSFTIEVRERYGQDMINYQIFPDRNLNTFQSLYLRNAGVPDNQNTFFRDALAHTLVLNKMDLDCQAYQPAVVFINGQYWGIYNIRDKIDASYLASLHHLNPSDIDLLEYTGSSSPEVMEGNADNYTAFYNYFKNNDLSSEQNYHFIEKWMDIDEYINYQICEIFYDNVFWPDQNMRMWRERKDDKKWRWVLYDVDFGLGMPNQQSIGYRNNTLRHATSSKPTNNPPLWSTLIFRKLLANAEFKIKFIQRFSSYLNTIFHPDTVLSTLNRLQNNISSQMPRHINRWRNEAGYGTPIPDYGTWLNNVDHMKQFVRLRPAYQREHIIDYFALTGSNQIDFNIASYGKGTILVNHVERVTGNASGIYFKDIPLTLEAIPDIGYQFVKWEGLDDAYQNPVTISVLADLLNITAHFESISVNIIPSIIQSDTVLNRPSSPYYATAHVQVDSNTTLTIESGVQILMPEKASIIVNGRLIITGTEDEPVVIKSNPYTKKWGALCFVNASDSSAISHLEIIGASKGPDFSRDRAAVSGYNSNFSLDHVSVVDVEAPVFVQYGKVSITNSNLHSDISGDLINIKYAESALVENCLLRGNDSYDSDAIDYDQISQGIIRGNRIYNFYGFNSDAIDLGEDSDNILIENNIIYNISDKGVSIGQGSTATIKRNLIANCDMGFGIKDFYSFGYAEHNTLYGNNYGIACYEKNIGVGGGTAEVINCIIANSKTSALLVDALSSIDISYSMSNTDELAGLYNTFAEPGFRNNLTLSANSPAIDLGNPTLPADPDGSLPDLGAFPFDAANQINLIINEIHYHPLQGQDYEFVELVNAGDESLNLENFQLEGDIHFVFPAVTLSAGEYCVVAKNAVLFQGQGYQVYQWQIGDLPDGVGTILLLDDQFNLVDYVNYDSKYWWPKEANGLGPSLELHHTSLENMVSHNWRCSYQSGGSPGKSNNSTLISGIYINEFLASNSNINQDEFGEYDDWIEIYNSNDLPVNLGGFYITDNLDRPGKFQISNSNSQLTTIPAKGYLLFWADGQTEQGIRHVSYKLDKEGEQIGLAQLVENDTVLIDSLSFGEQVNNKSYGRYPDGNENWFQFETPTPLDSNQIETSIDDQQKTPLKFSLSQNYPNPFNAVTSIKYQVPGRWPDGASISEVEMSIYNILGQKVATLVSQKQISGSYKVEWDASNFSSGVYFYRLETNKGFVQTKKLVHLK